MRLAGYLINSKEGLQGEHGFFYDYILAENGVFITAKSPLLEATVCVSEGIIRGLLPLEEKVSLLKGKIPRNLYNLALDVCYSDCYHERYLAVIWNDGYHLKNPVQTIGEAKVEYEPVPDAVMDIHSHGTMGAFNSGTDNADEQGLRLYMVVGKLNTLIPDVRIRAGAYGYWYPLQEEEVFG